MCKTTFSKGKDTTTMAAPSSQNSNLMEKFLNAAAIFRVENECVLN